MSPSMGNEKEFMKRLPCDIRRIAEVIGVELALKLAKEFRGTYLYMGNIDSLERGLRDLRVRKDSNGGVSIRNLAMKYRLSERQIKNILYRKIPVKEGLKE